MTTRSTAFSLPLMLVPLFLPAALNCASAEQRFCCPRTVFYNPKVPCVRYKRICTKTPCAVEHFGYYPTCWQPWPFPPDYSHCPVPPITSAGPSGPAAAPAGQDQLPSPEKMKTEPKIELPNKTQPQPKK